MGARDEHLTNLFTYNTHYISLNTFSIKIYIILQNIYDASSINIRNFIDINARRYLFDYLLVVYDHKFIPYTCLFIIKNIYL